MYKAYHLINLSVRTFVSFVVKKEGFYIQKL